jgi:hypothetical protein
MTDIGFPTLDISKFPRFGYAQGAYFFCSLQGLVGVDWWFNHQTMNKYDKRSI